MVDICDVSGGFSDVQWDELKMRMIAVFLTSWHFETAPAPTHRTLPKSAMTKRRQLQLSVQLSSLNSRLTTARMMVALLSAGHSSVKVRSYR